MGRLNLTALNVRKTALAKLKSRQITVQPSWMDVMTDVPPAQILIRQQPKLHPIQRIRTTTVTLPSGQVKEHTFATTTPKTPSRASRKAKQIFQPKQLRYEEDSLRRTFYSDHPWELARPRVVLETSGDSHAGADWSRGLIQPGIPLSGESVVQRQLHLLATVPDITVAQSYDIARKEFYTLRRREERRDRIAEEEARHTGAQFGPSWNKIALGVENKAYNEWEAWARSVVFERTARQAATEGGSGVPKAEENMLRANNAAESGGGGGREPVDEQDPLREVLPATSNAMLGRSGRSGRRIGQDVFAQQAQRDAGISRRPTTTL